MPSLEHLLTMVDRAMNGPTVSQEEWDLQIISEKTTAILKANGLIKTCDRQNPVNCDDLLADTFWKAGVELAAQTGMYCIDTERIIHLSEEEIADAIANQPAEVCYGIGKDQTVRRRRRPEDGARPIYTGIIGTPLSEDLYVDVTAAIAALPEVDCISGATLVSVYGRRVIGDTPYETAAGYYEARLKREATKKAGRPGMSLTATETSPTALGTVCSFAAPGGFDPTIDIVAILGISELKTCFELFHRAIHAIQCGGRLRGGQPAMIGGYGGGVEAAVVLNIALTILQRGIYGINYGCGNVLDVRYQGNCGSVGMWGQSVLNQAISRNSNFLADAVAFQVAGPNTEMLLLESAVGNLVCGVSGASGGFGPYSSGGIKVDYVTPLETIFCADMLRAGARMTRKQVNDICKELIPRYEKNLFDPPAGQSIRECYDLKTMQPNDDWHALYTRVRQELVAMGVKLDDKE